MVQKINLMKFLLRAFDIVISLFAITVLIPLFLLVILILSVTGEGEIFYFQERVGINMKAFKLIKFATMKKNSETIGTKTITIKNDHRVLPFGKILRKTKINELPQLLNILRGDMSVVGPRPLLKKQFMMYNLESRQIISSVKPGLTGIGSLVFRDEEKLFSGSNSPDKVYQKYISPIKSQLERWYIKNISISMYFKIIILTFISVLFPSINMINLIDDELRHKYKKLLERY